MSVGYPSGIDNPGSVYFVQSGRGSGRPIKIGFTSQSVETRTANHQPGNPDPLVILGSIPGTRRVELAWHQTFAHQRIRPKSEWFNPTPPLVNAIRQAIGSVAEWENHN